MIRAKRVSSFEREFKKAIDVRIMLELSDWWDYVDEINFDLGGDIEYKNYITEPVVFPAIVITQWRLNRYHHIFIYRHRIIDCITTGDDASFYKDLNELNASNCPKTAWINVEKDEEAS